MQQWILDKLYELGQFVAALQQEVRDLKSQAEVAERTEIQNRSARPAWWQVAIGVAGVVVSIVSLIVAIIALRAAH